jgi:hypothetical protein
MLIKTWFNVVIGRSNVYSLGVVAGFLSPARERIEVRGQLENNGCN